MNRNTLRNTPPPSVPLVFQFRVNLGDGAGARVIQQSDEYETARYLLSHVKLLKAALGKVQKLRRDAGLESDDQA